MLRVSTLVMLGNFGVRMQTAQESQIHADSCALHIERL